MSRRRPQHGFKQGFTLLEVMVAVAILAASLAAIFASEAQSMKVGMRARRTTTATLLARCKLGEIEEKILLEGRPAENASGSDACCEDAELAGYTCDWKIERVVLPEITDTTPEEGAAAGDGKAPSSLGDIDPSSPESISSLVEGGASGDAIAGMALEIAYPVLKPSIEEQVQRATVTVKWKEGTRERSFDVVQFLVFDPAPAAPATP